MHVLAWVLLLCVPVAFCALEICPQQVPEVIEIDDRVLYQYRGCGEKKKTILLSRNYETPVVFSSKKYKIFSTDDLDFRVYDALSEEDPTRILPSINEIVLALGVALFFIMLTGGMTCGRPW